MLILVQILTNTISLGKCSSEQLKYSSVKCLPLTGQHGVSCGDVRKMISEAFYQCSFVGYATILSVSHLKKCIPIDVHLFV